jgi:quinohemoprotein ethanol dehydrogenase
MRISFLLVMALIAACSRQEEAPVKAVAPMPPVALEQPATAAPLPDTDWTLHGNDWREQRHSALDQINRKTVEELGLAWTFNMYTQRGVEATPLVIDGVMYVTGSWSMVYALDARTGELKWFYDPQVDRSFLAKGCCDAVNRGVAYTDGKVIVATYDGRLVALKAGDGSVIWDVQTTDREQPYTITGAPRIARDKVIIGNGGAELGVRGYVSAYAIATGEMLWRFYTVPGNPQDGFENEAMEKAAATWTGKWWEWGGGGTAWDSIVYDPELDLIYVGVGNGAPWNARVRSPEGGDNLYLSSIVALQADTGDYVWHYQTTPGDTWDYTATQHIMLGELDIDGKPRKVLMQAPKNGFFYVLDRETGELISAEKYGVVNWASHVDMATGRPVETADARVFNGENVTLPSNAGAHNWPPMAYSAEAGLVYIPTIVFPVTFLEATQEKDSKPGQGYWNVGFDRMGGSPPKIPEQDLGAVIDSQFQGQLVAWDPVKQEARWKGPVVRPVLGGVLSTAGGLLFTSAGAEELKAFDAATGEELWSGYTGNAAAAPISYSLDGEQYIAIAQGFGGGYAAEGGPVAHAWKVKNMSRVMVFKLGGTAEPPAARQDNREMPKPAAVTADAAVLERGEVVYHRHCGYCHGDGLRTGGVTPDLRWASGQTHEIWEDIVRGGVLQARGMVSFSEYVSEDDAEAIRQYVLSEANRLYSQQQPAETTGQ